MLKRTGEFKRTGEAPLSRIPAPEAASAAPASSATGTSTQKGPEEGPIEGSDAARPLQEVLSELRGKQQQPLMAQQKAVQEAPPVRALEPEKAPETGSQVKSVPEAQAREEPAPPATNVPPVSNGQDRASGGGAIRDVLPPPSGSLAAYDRNAQLTDFLEMLETAGRIDMLLKTVDPQRLDAIFSLAGDGRYRTILQSRQADPALEPPALEPLPAERALPEGTWPASSGRSPADAGLADPGQPYSRSPRTLPDIRLIAVESAAGDSAALIALPDGTRQHLRRGDHVRDGWRLDTIRPGSVILTDGSGRKWRLGMRDPSAGALGNRLQAGFSGTMDASGTLDGVTEPPAIPGVFPGAGPSRESSQARGPR